MLLLIAPAMLAHMTLLGTDYTRVDQAAEELTYHKAYNAKMLYRVDLFRREPDNRISASAPTRPRPMAARRLPASQRLIDALDILRSDAIQVYASCNLDKSGAPRQCDIQGIGPNSDAARSLAVKILSDFRLPRRSAASPLSFNRSVIYFSFSKRPLSELPQTGIYCTLTLFCGIPHSASN